MAGETAAQKATQAAATKALAEVFTRMSTPTDSFGMPLVKISVACAELVPTVQYGNCTIGPVMVERYVPDGDMDYMRNEIKKLQELVREAVAEDRQTLHEQLRSAS